MENMNPSTTHSNSTSSFGVHAILAGLAVAVGVLMLVVIIPVEDEPTAVPLVLIASGLGWFAVMRRRPDPRPATIYRLGAAAAIGGAILLAWLSLGVGIIGADGDPNNMMYFGVIAVGLVGAIRSRFAAGGMVKALTATALSQGVVFIIAVAAGLGQPWSGPLELFGLNGFFIAVFAASALLFRQIASAPILQN